MTYILLESNREDDTDRLDRAWAGAESFVFVPAKAGVSDEFLADAIGRLPEEYGRGHFLLLTSGSTGEPKLVVGERERTNQLARTLHTIQSSDPVEETLVALPLSYSYAFVNQWRWSRVHQRRLVYTAGFSDPKSLLGALARQTTPCSAWWAPTYKCSRGTSPAKRFQASFGCTLPAADFRRNGLRNCAHFSRERKFSTTMAAPKRCPA